MNLFTTKAFAAERWRKDGVSEFIKSLVAEDGRLIKFSPARECTNPCLVRLYEYDVKFIQRDAEQIALFRMRLVAVQKEAQKSAEAARIRLIKDNEKVKKKAAHKEQKLTNKQAKAAEGEASSQNLENLPGPSTTKVTKKPKKRVD